MAGLNKALKTGDLDAAQALTFDDAVKLGNGHDVTKPVVEQAAE